MHDPGCDFVVDVRRRLGDVVSPDDQPFVPRPHHPDQPQTDAADVRAGLQHPVQDAGPVLHEVRKVGMEDDIHTARDVHLSLERQPDVRGHLAAATVGADDVLGANCRTRAGDSITHLHVHAVGVLGEAQILGVEADPAAPGCRVPHDDRLQQRLRDIAVEGRAGLDVVRLARRVRPPRPHPAQLVAGEAGTEHGFAHQRVRRGRGQHILLNAEIAKHLHRALIGDVGARRVRRPPILGQHHMLDPERGERQRGSTAGRAAADDQHLGFQISGGNRWERCRAGRRPRHRTGWS